MNQLRPQQNATNVTNATGAANATNATNATGAANATNVTNATGAANATNATNATGVANATNATNATGAANATNATGASNVSNATNATEQLWLPIYNEANFTKEDVVVDLTKRGIYGDFVIWYNLFFDTNGIVVQNFTS